MTFQAKPSDAFAAHLEAARRTGFQYLSGDVSTGTAMFTSGRFLLVVGEKLNAGDAVHCEVRHRRVGPPRFRCRPSV